MSYLIDTCVLSELTRPEPEPAVTKWIQEQNEMDLFITVLVLGELEKGIAMLPDSSKKNRLQAWLYTDLCERFRGRILEITPEIALEWGRISGRTATDGRTIPVIDALLGASAIIHSMVVVTRNTEDIIPTGAPVLDPWGDGVNS